jgi:hypothetical protein
MSHVEEELVFQIYKFRNIISRNRNLGWSSDNTPHGVLGAQEQTICQ